MRVLQVGRETDLSQEALGAKDCRQFGPEQLERHGPVMLQVAGEIDCGHAAAPELAVEAVAIMERISQCRGPGQEASVSRSTCESAGAEPGSPESGRDRFILSAPPPCPTLVRRSRT